MEFYDKNGNLLNMEQIMGMIDKFKRKDDINDKFEELIKLLK